MDDVLNLTADKTTPYGGSTSSTSYTTNAMNESTAIGAQDLSCTDAASLENDGAHLSRYDAHEHLIEVRMKSNNALVAEYAYDALGLGRRLGKTVGSAVTRYVYAGQQPIEEYDGTGSGANLRRLFVFGEQIDQVAAMDAPDAADVDSDSNTSEIVRLSFHAQLIGSVTQVTAPSQSVVESCQYDPYGKITIKDAGGSTVSASAIGNPCTCTGRQFDQKTGLCCHRARMYSPELRRFIQRVPLEYVDGLNAVAYCSSTPTRSIDPFGELGEDSAVAIYKALSTLADATAEADERTAETDVYDATQDWCPKDDDGRPVNPAAGDDGGSLCTRRALLTGRLQSRTVSHHDGHTTLQGAYDCVQHQADYRTRWTTNDTQRGPSARKRLESERHRGPPDLRAARRSVALVVQWGIRPPTSAFASCANDEWGGGGGTGGKSQHGRAGVCDRVTVGTPVGGPPPVGVAAGNFQMSAGEVSGFEGSWVIMESSHGLRRW